MSDDIRGWGDPPEVERRRHPRRPAGPDLTLTLPTVVEAEVLDINAGGALISSSGLLQVGQRARLRTLLGGEPFTAWFEVLRADEGTQRGHDQRYRLGVAFTALPEQAQVTLQRFVKTDDRAS